MKDVDIVTGEIIDAAYQLHVRLGPGLMEAVYEALLAQALERRGLHVERQKKMSFDVDGLCFQNGLRLDLLVEGEVVVELKSVEHMAASHQKQVLTYLRALNLQVGLLLNFGAPTMKAGTRRVVNNYNPSASLSSPPRLRVNRSSNLPVPGSRR